MSIQISSSSLRSSFIPGVRLYLRPIVYWEIWSLTVLCLLLSCGAALSQTNPVSAEQIPPLRPPRGEIPPSFWEQHTPDIVLASLIVVIVLGASVWFLVRPKPPILVSPEAQARQELEALRAQPETGILLSKVSQILRHYFTAAFGLPTGESTTAEFCKLIAADKRIGEDLKSAMCDFLRQCDERKFAPQPPAPPINAVTEALKLIDSTQARLNTLSEAEATESVS